MPKFRVAIEVDLCVTFECETEEVALAKAKALLPGLDVCGLQVVDPTFVPAGTEVWGRDDPEIEVIDEDYSNG